MMTKTLTLLAILAAFAAPQVAQAYLNPEDVLLNRELFMPPEAREAKHRTTLQAEESAARREREQERAFALQHPEPDPEPVIEETLHGAAPAMPGNAFFVYPAASPGMGSVFGAAPSQWAAPQPALSDANNLELLRTMRLLSRVQQNQAVSELERVLHSGAPDLAPTGAGSILAMGTMLGAVFYTIRRAGKTKVMTKKSTVM